MERPTFLKNHIYLIERDGTGEIIEGEFLGMAKNISDMPVTIFKVIHPISIIWDALTGEKIEAEYLSTSDRAMDTTHLPTFPWYVNIVLLKTRVNDDSIVTKEDYENLGRGAILREK